jgi:hypothetical protein
LCSAKRRRAGERPHTVVQVVALAREGLMVEVEVVAVLPPSG